MSSRRLFLSGLGASCLTLPLAGRAMAMSDRLDPKFETTIRRGLDYLARTQSSRGQWNTPPYPTAIAALAGTALLCSGSTATQGPYAKNISRTTDFLLSKCRDNGLIGDPAGTDSRYTYGHGFSMLFLSQVLGEEGLIDRREELVEALNKAVRFCGQSQTNSGGWGYVSAKEGNDYDEGSTTITQVQGLRSCRNAGISVPSEIIESAKQYMYSCQEEDGGISYSSKQKGSRPAITAASLAALYNAGDYDSKHVPKMLEYCKTNLHEIGKEESSFGHWHYTYLYYAQVVYRQGDQEWLPFRNNLYDRISSQQSSDGSWEGQINKIYTSACNLIMLQLDRGYLPIFQR